MKVYSLINKEFGEVEYVSIDKEVIEELMCDIFMLDFQQQCQADVDERYIDMEHPDKDASQIIQHNWNLLIYWFKEYYEIGENRLI